MVVPKTPARELHMMRESTERFSLFSEQPCQSLQSVITRGNISPNAMTSGLGSTRSRSARQSHHHVVAWSGLSGFRVRFIHQRTEPPDRGTPARAPPICITLPCKTEEGDFIRLRGEADIRKQPFGPGRNAGPLLPDEPGLGLQMIAIRVRCPARQAKRLGA